MLVYKTRYLCLLVTPITITALIIRFVVTDFSVLESYDARLYYEYGASIAYQGRYPQEPPLYNLGWPWLLSGLFYFMPSTQSMLFPVQHFVALLFSVALVPISYKLCRNYFNVKYSLIGSCLVAFDWRLIQNQSFALTEPMFLFFGMASLWLVNKKPWLAWLLVGIASITRFEGLMFIPVLFLLSDDRKKLLRYSVILVIPLLAAGGMFADKASHELFALENHYDKFSKNILNSIIYMGWATFPTFIFLIPFGLRRMSWVASLVVLAIPGLWAYLDAHDTRYFFPMFPILVLVSLDGLKLLCKLVKRHK